MSFFIAFLEACGVELSLGHFSYIFRIKVIVKHAWFGYLTGRGDAARIEGLPSNVGQ